MCFILLASINGQNVHIFSERREVESTTIDVLMLLGMVWGEINGNNNKRSKPDNS